MRVTGNPQFFTAFLCMQSPSITSSNIIVCHPAASNPLFLSICPLCNSLNNRKQNRDRHTPECDSSLPRHQSLFSGNNIQCNLNTLSSPSNDVANICQTPNISCENPLTRSIKRHKKIEQPTPRSLASKISCPSPYTCCNFAKLFSIPSSGMSGYLPECRIFTV